jgi:dipeptidase D
MNASVADLNPSLLWKHFAALSAIPRCSRDEAAVRAYVKARAAEWGLTVREDAAGNIVVAKPASAGLERRTGVVLQGHLDMVCEQNRDGKHDFSCDPIELVVDGDWVRAEGTTLGADNGIGAAAMLAVLEDRSLVHGPLECLFTADEETGLTGALGLDPALISGRTLLNLDSEDEGRFTVGCAGGVTSWAEIPVTGSPTDAAAGWSLLLTGLEGGHSGVEIHRQTGNALKYGARFLAEFLAAQPAGAWQVASLEGGDKHNAIPREALALLAGPADGMAVLKAAADAATLIYAAELGPEGRSVRFEIAEKPVPALVLTPASQQIFLDLVAAVPDGVQGWSKAVPGLVETSCNLASLRVADNLVRLTTSQRSSSTTARDEITRRIASAVRLTGGTVRNGDGYPAWAPAAVSPVRDAAVALWKRLTGTEAVVELIHAGLECGVIGDRVPGMDMLSFGPTIKGAHTPSEKVETATVARFHEFLTALLKDL